MEASGAEATFLPVDESILMSSFSVAMYTKPLAMTGSLQLAYCWPDSAFQSKAHLRPAACAGVLASVTVEPLPLLP